MAALLLGAALVVSSLIVVRGIEYVKTYSTSQLEVRGSANRVVSSDQARWVAVYNRSVEAGALARGYDLMAADLDRVVAILAANGFSGADLTISPVSVNGVYRECYNATSDCVRELIGHDMSRWFTVNTADIAGVTRLAQDVRPFVQAGLSLYTSSLEYYYSGLDGARPELLAEATADAKQRAEAVAASTGASVGPLQSVESGIFQVTQVNSTDVADYGIYDTSTIEKRITAVVRARFALR